MTPMQVKKPVLVALAKNLAMGIPPIRAARVNAGRTAAMDPQVDGLDTYAYNLLGDVLQHLGPVQGKSVLEFGPGDNILAGLAFLAAGARSYTALDRFPGAYSSETARRWYRLLAEHWPTRHPDKPWPQDLDPNIFPNDPRVTVIKHGVEAVESIDQVDIVCSYVVAEHVLDTDAFARATYAAIGADGQALHVIDFGGHEWNVHGDPFLFLKFPDWLWRLMGSNRGVPNRVRFDAYVAAFERAGLKVDVVERKIVDYDPADDWVRERASEAFLTHWAVVRLTRA